MCIAHTMLLQVDGLDLDKLWSGIEVPTSTWEGDLGDLEEIGIPQALHWILSPTKICTYDTLLIGIDNQNTRLGVTCKELDKEDDKTKDDD